MPPTKVVREHLPRQETFSSGHCPNYQEVGPIFLNVKNDVLARITEPSNDDYDNDGSDNCDLILVLQLGSTRFTRPS